MRHIGVLLAATLLAPASAAAIEGSISDELSVHVLKGIPHNPRTGTLTDTVAATLQVAESLAFDLSLSGTWSRPTPPVTGESYGTRGGIVWAFTGGIEWAPSDHFFLALSGAVSPRSRLLADSAMPLGEAEVNVLLSSATSSQGAMLIAGFDTAGDSRAETSVMLGVSGTRLATTQRVMAVRTLSGASVTVAEAERWCQEHPLACGPQLQAALAETRGGGAIGQFALSASVMETLFQKSELALSFSYYLYTSDPTEIGFFSLAAVGRSEVSFGGGVPLAPVRWTLRPEFTQRFGDLSLRLSYLHQRYVQGEGQANSLALKAQYRFNRAWRAWLSAAVERDKDAEGYFADSFTLGAGFRFSF